MEDMNRFPSREIRVDVEGSEVRPSRSSSASSLRGLSANLTLFLERPQIPQEELYQIFRPYGKIHDIVPVSPKQARIIYTSIRSAASARNCLHAASTSAPHEAVLRILYADAKRTSYVKDFATSHPRITIPLIVALLGTISYAVFDPIRELSVMAKVEGTFDADQWAAVRWLKRETIGRLADHFRLSGAGGEGLGRGGTGIEKEREEAREQLRNWLVDRPDTFVVVTGPQGSGKTALVDEVLADGKCVLSLSSPPRRLERTLLLQETDFFSRTRAGTSSRSTATSCSRTRAPTPSSSPSSRRPSGTAPTLSLPPRSAT